MKTPFFANVICDLILENRPCCHKYWNPFFACRRKSHSCSIQKHQALETRWPGLLFQAAFFRRCKTTRVHFMTCVALRGINKTAWGAKLILTAGLAYPVNCASLGHLLTAQHCHLCLNICFSPPTAPHPPPQPTPPPPTRPPPIDSIRVITAVQKNCLKNQRRSNSLRN